MLDCRRFPSKGGGFKPGTWKIKALWLNSLLLAPNISGKVLL
jgi:hypothetical protein